MSQLIGAILTGGASARMGTDKSTVAVAGRSMGSWVSAALHAAGPIGHVIALGDVAIDGIRRFDDGPGTGPLAGVAGLGIAMVALGTKSEAVFVAAVDQPWLRPDTIEALCARYAGLPIVPLDAGRRQVTCAVYSMDFVEQAVTAAAAAPGFQTILDGIDVDIVPADEWESWGEDGRSWFSVDRSDDIERGLARFGSPQDPR